ncbi:similar to Saccharomyces cerevisiae YDL202W MRPL11 Mitochondrial ribosomal protein of the large subunit [Maudiozyma barnettii]|uniref:Similar to Saccharomyces cerevisiae YDL202W MRPL11 Mitochondrial ribosomal protein of the large subunit n=1 Tax=Maudiozyma barnettii TaxID=61262 RepID=A0A8H2ZIP1_9SACH|nr:mitochondrial 54S ribosomal protein YmL11 [Kazachstania barnettii]CAB4255168.1 similar to Saccharomyces cerevisiae YDL202W MRPL11 Mitochondrial ribosomal protein of the large subunit [Kazachstania barnettii]CAD1783439.1 similar to Saccharomyces cerevisiae YDL202W MRPL11 Mitochondrial ribosomal protein of the large subunit [Kazachstania barnettii]
MLKNSLFLINPHLLRCNGRSLTRMSSIRFGSSAVITAKPQDIELNNGRQTVKAPNSRKTFLIDSYKHMMETHPVVIFLHYNNLIKSEDHYFRDQIKTTNGTLHKIRNNLFKVYLKNSSQIDPCAPIDSKDETLIKNHPLHPLFSGPTAAITYKDINPTDIAKLIKVLNLAKDKLFVIGAKIDAEVMDPFQLGTFSKLPSLPQLQATLVSMLQMSGGGGLVQTLESSTQKLYLTLKSHEDNIKEPKE